MEVVLLLNTTIVLVNTTVLILLSHSIAKGVKNDEIRR